MKRIATWFAVFGALVVAAPGMAETLPYKDGRIPEEQQGTEQLVPVQAFRNTVYFEGFLLYYTKNRFNIVTRYKPPVCPGGVLDTAFYTKTMTKYGFVTTPEHIVRPEEQGQVQEYTYSTMGYFGPLDEAKVKLHVRSNCTLTPTAPAPQTEVINDLPPLPELPPLPPRPVVTPEVQIPPPAPAPRKSQEELFKELVPAPTPLPEKLDLAPAPQGNTPTESSRPAVQPLAPLPPGHPLLR